MEFNPGKMKYEPNLPFRKGRTRKTKINWFWIILAVVGIIVISSLYLLFSDNWNLNSCIDECQHRGYNAGYCLWPDEAGEEQTNIGSCLIAQSKHCGNKGQCNCYCDNTECSVDSDCVVFGQDGDCNCGCYNKDNLPSDTGGKCFCAAPVDCSCINGKCEGIF